MKAKTIAFCGIDGSGKTTQLKLVKDFLTPKKVLIAKAGYHPLNEMGQSKLLDLMLEAKSGIEILKYYLKLQNKDIYDYDFILYDRYLPCFLAYAYAYNVHCLKLIRNALKILQDPDLTLYFDIDPNTAIERILKRDKPLDKSENIDTLTKAKEGYELLMKLFPNVENIDASTDEATEQKEIQKILRKNHFI